MVRKRTRTGARRAGDDYQDLVAANALLCVLKNPRRYSWVKFEAREAGKLDDLLARRNDGTVEATQVKFSTDVMRAGDAWTWDKLLDQRKGLSFVQQWSHSITGLHEVYGAVEPRLYSNRQAGADLFLTNDRCVDVGRTDSGVLQKIREQLGDAADDFLRRFRFEVAQQDLLDLDDSLAREFTELGLPEGNWPQFKDAIRNWINGESLPAGAEIAVERIRSAAGWRQLARLPQNLEVPTDYTLPAGEFHTEFLRRIERQSGSVVVLTAGPGVGKSTYLSYLERTPTESKRNLASVRAVP